jgi:hypothetical protein
MIHTRPVWRAIEHLSSPARRWGVFIGALAVATTAMAGGSSVIGGFGGPLFGLAEGRNAGELLVADQSVGIIPIRKGAAGAPIELPGVTDVSVHGSTIWALTGATGPAPQGTQNDTGQGLHVISRGEVRKVANLFEFEATFNPHTAAPPNPPDSNPYDVHALGSHAALLVDAGGNDLLKVDRRGNIKVLAVFPDELVPTANIKALAGCPASAAPFCALPDAIPAQPVPTSIAVDRRGYIYVGELKGFPAPAGESNIWRISPNANGAQCGTSPDCVKVFDGGFTSVIDLAFGPDGLLYVTELDEGSWAAVEIFGTPQGGTINACSVRKGLCYEVASDVPVPTAITFDKKGALWATRNALTPGGGEVVKIRPAWHKGWRHSGHSDRGD